MYPKINRHAYHSQRHSIVVCPTASVGVNSAAVAAAVVAAVAAIPITTPPQSIPFVQCQYDRHQRNKNVEQCHTNGGAQSTQANAQRQGGTGECNGIPDKEQPGQCLYHNICDGHASHQKGKDHLQRWFEGTKTIQIKFQIPNDISGIRCS